MAEITKKEFLELLEEFSKKTLDPKFEKIDSQFAEVNSQFEKIDDRFEKIDSRFAQIDSRFIEFREDIIHQFHVISEDVISKVQLVAEGVANLNEKLDRHIDENQREHKDILAAIKFSYAELDKRMTVLETEMEDLKRRMDKIERRSVS
jgi:archaellum component FlaC